MLAERRRRASKVPEVLASLSALAQHIKDLSAQLEALPLSSITEAVRRQGEEGRQAIAGLPVERLVVDVNELLHKMEASKVALGAQIAALASNMPQKAPDPKPVDLSGVEGRLEVLIARKPQVMPQPVPSAMTLHVVSRDDEGDIETVEVEVTQH